MALYEHFTKLTGVKVNLIEGGSDALIERIVNEGEFSPADMLITVDAGRIWRAQEKGIFQAIESKTMNERVPAHLRNADGFWYGLSKRARVIAFNKKRGLPIEVNQLRRLGEPCFSRPSVYAYIIKYLQLVANECADRSQWRNCR